MTEKKNLQVITYVGNVKIAVEAEESEGRYSRSFVTEMSRQLTRLIESAAGVTDISGSDLILALLFAPDTFMEHISDNVTYRRLLLLDGASAPRDFWVKWTRIDGAVAHHLSDDVNNNISFELGEDVSQKIREKEYRYLVGTDLEKYHDAISRKNVTEWRDIIKRLIRRGELTKVEIDQEISKETLDLQEKLLSVLGMSSAKTEELPDEVPVDLEFEKAMQKARELVDSDFIEETEVEEEIEIDEEIEIEEAEIEEEAIIEEKIEEEPEIKEIEIEEEPDTEEIEEELEEEEAPMTLDDVLALAQEIKEEKLPETSSEETELEEITRMALEALAIAKESKESEEEEFPQIVFEIEEEPAEPQVVEEPAEEIIEEVKEESVEESISREVYSRADDIRAEIEAKIRLEFESRARMQAEQELAALRREQELMKLENERLQAEAKREQEKMRLEYERLMEQTQRAQAVREAQEAVRRAEEDKLRAQIEAQLRREAHERERLAEAARLAIDEQNRLRAEAERAQRQRDEEIRLAEEKRRMEQHEAELEAAREAELERIRREAEEARTAAQRAMPVMGDGKYTYTSKTVKLIFRRSVDPNITTRIYEIIKATLEYYGKDKVYLKIKASVPDAQTVCLEFVHIPIEEMQLLGNIIKILGNSGLGIAKAIVE